MEESGVESVFVEKKTVMNGGNYVRGKRRMGLISEAFHRLQLLEFFKHTDCFLFQGLFGKIEELQKLFEREKLYQCKIQRKWNECENDMSDFTQAFDKYKEERKLQSEQFQY